MYQRNITNIVKVAVENKKLENQYGWASCFDVPKAYDKMEKLSVEVREMIKEIVEEERAQFFTVERIDAIVDHLAFEISQENIEEENIEEVILYDQDEFLETFIVGNMDEKQLKTFESLFYFMNSFDRGKWLQVNEKVINDNHMFTDKIGEVFVKIFLK